MMHASLIPVPRMIPRDNSPLRIALAGYGNMGHIHFKAIQSLQAGDTEDYYKADLPQHIHRIRVCGICDSNPDKQSLLSGQRFYQNWDQLLEEQRPHVAIIAAPTAVHYELAIKALKAGIHTLVEKPISPTLKECQQLIQLAEQQGCRLLAGHVERYNPVAIKLHHLIHVEGLRIDHYQFERTQTFPSRIPDDIITDKLIHDLDLALHFFGSVTQIECLACKRVEGRIMETEIQLTHGNGIRGQLFVSWLVPPEAPKYRQVYLQEIHGDTYHGDFIRKQLTRNNVNLPCGVQGWSAPENNQIKDQLVDFLAYCLEPVPGIPSPLLSPAEMQESICIIEQIRSLSHHV